MNGPRLTASSDVSAIMPVDSGRVDGLGSIGFSLVSLYQIHARNNVVICLPNFMSSTIKLYKQPQSSIIGCRRYRKAWPCHLIGEISSRCRFRLQVRHHDQISFAEVLDRLVCILWVNDYSADLGEILDHDPQNESIKQTRTPSTVAPSDLG